MKTVSRVKSFNYILADMLKKSLMSDFMGVHDEYQVIVSTPWQYCTCIQSKLFTGVTFFV